MMDVLAALRDRVSVSRLTDPAPEGEAREQIFSAALRAPDHGRLTPWRFLVVEGDARARLGEAMEQAMRSVKPDLTDVEASKLRSNPMRAPLLVVLVTHLQDHPKVPEIEQHMSLACATQNMLLAAHALGFGAIWRTGPVTFVPALREQLGLAPNECIQGFLYIGTPAIEQPRPQTPAVADHFLPWSG